MAYNIVTGARQTLRLSTLQIVQDTYDTAPTEIKVQGWNQVVLYCDLALNTATSVEIQVQVAAPADVPGQIKDAAPASGDWHTLAYIDTALAAGTTGTKQIPVRLREYQLPATNKYAIELPIAAKWMRVRAKTTGAVGTTTLAIIGQQGMA